MGLLIWQRGNWEAVSIDFGARYFQRYILVAKSYADINVPPNFNRTSAYFSRALFLRSDLFLLLWGGTNTGGPLAREKSKAR